MREQGALSQSEAQRWGMVVRYEDNDMSLNV